MRPLRRTAMFSLVFTVLFLLGGPGARGQEEAPPEGTEPPASVSIMEIQGSEQVSARAGSAVETTGVVTQHRADGAGFWIQDTGGDGSPATSDGVYVAWAEAAAGVPRPKVGSRVRVTGRVEEEQSGNALPRTRITALRELAVLDPDVALPAPVSLLDLPNLELADAIAFWEPLEGMRVQVPRAVVVGPTEAWGELAVIAEADAVGGSGYFPETGHVLVRSLGGDRVDYNPELIVLQTLAGRAPQVRTGDRMEAVEGVVDYLHGTYKVWLDRFQAQVRELPATPISTRSGEPGTVRIVSYNVRDLLDTMDRPGRLDEGYSPTSGELDVHLEKLALSIVSELELPHVVVANEFESAGLLQTLGDRVNLAAGTRYRSASLDTSDPRGLEVGFLYDEDRVDLLDYQALSGPEVYEAFGSGEGRFIPGREPLVGTFRFSDDGPVLSIIANKFKTKRLEDPRLNVLDGPVRHTEVQRKLQARVVRRKVDELLAADPQALVLVTGDLGDFQFAEPEEGEDHPIGILEGLGDQVRLTNLIDLEEPGEGFTYVFQGNSMAMTHMLVSPALLELLAGADVLHFNAGYPDSLKEDRRTPFRASDRDPVEGRFNFPGVPP